MQRILVWDLPVRVFHWALVALVTTSWITAETGLTTIHSWSGYGVLGLVVFRLVWGLVGSEHARFGDFLSRPAAAWSYLKNMLGGANPHYDGHNPAGGWMVMALLAVLLLQVGTGLFATDEILFDGPFAPLVGGDWSEWLTEIHEASFNLLLALVVVHVAAVGLHELFGERLVRAMIDGRKHSDRPQGRVRPVWLALAVLGLAAGFVWWLLSLAPPPASGF